MDVKQFIKTECQNSNFIVCVVTEVNYFIRYFWIIH